MYPRLGAIENRIALNRVSIGANVDGIGRRGAIDLVTGNSNSISQACGIGDQTDWNLTVAKCIEGDRDSCSFRRVIEQNIGGVGERRIAVNIVGDGIGRNLSFGTKSELDPILRRIPAGYDT